MIQIPVRVAGDEWFNRASVCQQLLQAQNQPIMLDLGAEGPSLYRLGIVDAVLESGVDPSQVTVANWHNSVEIVPFERQIRHLASHFFWHHQLHTIADNFANKTADIFGIFIGRRTVARCKIFYDVWQQYRDKSCMSLMQATTPLPWQHFNGIAVEQFENWINNTESTDFQQWWKHPPVSSIDGVSIGDQYSADQNTNFSLLKFYNRFNIEIVCETYCYGDAFFPTEKTVRPIAAEKPFVLFGPAQFLQRLRQLGFKTYADFWDESYDKLEGLERWQAMQQVLQYIHRQHTAAWVDSVNAVAAYNRQVLQQVVKKHQPS
jgi:hypothetical protein